MNHPMIKTAIKRLNLGKSVTVRPGGLRLDGNIGVKYKNLLDKKRQNHDSYPIARGSINGFYNAGEASSTGWRLALTLVVLTPRHLLCINRR